MSASSVAILDGTGAAKSIASFTNAAGSQIYQVSGDSSVSHYAAAKNQLTPVATPTAVFVITGSATTTMRVKRIVLSGIATGAGEMPFSVKKNSTAGTLGSAALTALTATPYDSGSAAAGGVVSSVGTANYTTLPTIVGIVATGELAFAVSTSGNVAPQVLEFGQGGRQALVLRGVLECITVDLLGTALVSGGKVSMFVEWAEDAS